MPFNHLQQQGAMHLFIKRIFPVFPGSHSDIDIRQYLTELMSFLQRHGTLMSSDAHSCSWVSVVFAEQDDDMIESSKTLIGLYLYKKRFGICFYKSCYTVPRTISLPTYMGISRGINLQHCQNKILLKYLGRQS